jgi:hypothetical protein
MAIAAVIDRAARAAERSPTDAQKEAGNYRKGHVTLHGMNIAIENPRGSMRSGLCADGEPWICRMPSHYGYLKGTSGADGDQVDCYIGPDPECERIYVIDQIDADTHDFDEHKAMLGYLTAGDAVQSYLKAFSDGRGHERLGGIKEMSVDQFKGWLASGKTKKALKRAQGGRVYANGGSVEDNPQFLETRDAVEGMEGGDAPAAPQGLSFDHLVPKAEGTPASVGLSFDHLVPQKEKPKFKGVLRGAVEGIANAPSEGWELLKKRAGEVYDDLNPFNEERIADIEKGSTSGRMSNFLRTGKGVAGALGVPFALPEGMIRSAVGTPMAELIHKAGTYINPEVAAKDDREKLLEETKEGVSKSLMAVAPRRVTPTGPTAPVAPPAPPQPDALGVTLSQGQRTGELPLIRREQAALRGHMGEPAGRQAAEFIEQQAREVRGAAGDISQRIAGGNRTFDTPAEAAQAINTELGGAAAQARQARTSAEQMAISEEAAARRMVDDHGRSIGDIITEGRPEIGATREAGELTGQALRQAATRDRANYQRLYDEALGLEGQFHAGAFEGVGNRIQGRLTLGDNPVIIDDVTTPIASRAIRDLDNISHLRIQNRADPFGPPNPENVVAVDLRGVDQARKRLVAFYRAARSSNNAADARAAGRLIDEFDHQIETSITNGLFSGDPRALDALREARAAYSSYARQYRPQQAGDDVGNAMRRIIDRQATPEEIANMVIGSGRIGNSGLPVRIADRLETILGRDSDAWSAIRQGIWRKASQVRNTAGEVDPQRSATGIMDLAGSSLGRRIFRPEELREMRHYATNVRNLDEAVQALPSVRHAERTRDAYETIFGGEGIGGAQATTFRRIAEGTATPEETAQAVFHAISSGNPGNVSRLIRAVEGLTGPQSESMSAIRQGVWQKLVEPVGTADAPGAQRTHTALNQFLNGRGRTIANQLYSAPELDMMREFAQLQRQLVVPPTGANRSETSTFVAPMLRKLGSKLGMVIGAAVGHMVAPGLPWGVGEAAGAGAAKVIGKIGDRMDAKAIARQMPLVADATRQWQRAVNRVNRINSPQSRASLGIATSNLARSLEPMGIRLEGIGLLPSAAEPNANENQQ